MAHALLEFIREQMDVRGWTQADLARASGMSRSHVSKLLKDDRDRIAQLPREATINGVSTAFNVPRGVVLAKAVEALGVGYTAADFVHEITEATNEELVTEIARRLSITSYPGSGKTEAFVVPHLAQVAADREPSEGVRARAEQDRAGAGSQDDGEMDPR